METQRTALITGANKGIGFETARQLAEAGLRVHLAARDRARGEEAVQRLVDRGLDVRFVQLDVQDPGSIDAAARTIGQEAESLDVLVNNAGVASWQDGGPEATSLEVVRAMLETNFIGALAVTRAMLPLLLAAPAPRVVNVSSALGSLAVNGDRTSPFFTSRLLGYNASKAALNLLTVQLDAEYRERGLTAFSVSPGFAKTDLLGGIGDITAEEGAAVVAGAVLDPSTAAAGRHLSADGDIPW